MDARKGSIIAKGGFKNEDNVKDKFNNWENDEDAQSWLAEMGYNSEHIKELYAIKGAEARRNLEKRLGIKLEPPKTDVQIQVIVFSSNDNNIHVENIQVKLVSNKSGLNQIDKRWVSRYAELWNMSQEVQVLLKKFTGEIAPNNENIRDSRRMFMDEFEEGDREAILNFINDNKILIVNDILKGRGALSAEWFLVVQKIGDECRSVIKPINFVTNFFGNGEVKVSPRGSIMIGKILVQRKGGDGGRDTSKMLQFKINPVLLFENTNE